jgi:hypothetical protein
MKSSLAIFIWDIRDDVIVIYDLHNEENSSMSVTNDIENVIAVVNADIGGIGEQKVIYRDTELMYDEVIIKNNEFFKFNSLHEHSYLKAIKKVKENKNGEC